MARDENMIPLDKLFETTTKTFRIGKPKDEDLELDDRMWEMDEYETEEHPPGR